MLKPWTSQESFERAGTWRIRTPRTLSSVQAILTPTSGRDLRALRLVVTVFVEATSLPVYSELAIRQSRGKSLTPEGVSYRVEH